MVITDRWTVEQCLNALKQVSYSGMYGTDIPKLHERMINALEALMPDSVVKNDGFYLRLADRCKRAHRRFGPSASSFEIGDTLLEAEKACRRLADVMQENQELDRLFKMERERFGEALLRWRAEKPDERATKWPDLGKLLQWLMDQHDQVLRMHKPDQESENRIR